MHEPGAPSPADDEIVRRRETVVLRAGVAFVWLATGVLVLHPLYRAIGAIYLARLGLPAWLMAVTCAFEVALGLRVAFGRASGWLTLLQVLMIASFTSILALSEPRLLVSPFGMLTKNVPIVGCVLAAWLVEREGWSTRARLVLRVSIAAIWLTEGLLPKILFQQAEELLIAEQSGLAFGHPSALLRVIGVLQFISGILVLSWRGRGLSVVLLGQIVALVALPMLVSWQVPWLWFHPFGPFIKNVPIVCGSWVLLQRCSYSS